MDTTSEPQSGESAQRVGAAAGQVMSRTAGQAGKAVGKAVMRAGKAAGKAVLRWLLAWMGPWIGLGLLVLVCLMVVLGLLHGPAAKTKAPLLTHARSAVQGTVTVRSFDREELQFLPSPTLVAVLAWNLHLQHRHVSVTTEIGRVAAALRPTFTYTSGTQRVYTWLTSSHGKPPILASMRGAGQMSLVQTATTYQGTAQLAYTTAEHSVPCLPGTGPSTACTEKRPRLRVVSWTWNDAKYLNQLGAWFPGSRPTSMAKMLAFEAQRWSGTDIASLGLPYQPKAGVLSAVGRWSGVFRQYATAVVPVDLLEAVTAQESQGNPRAYSKAGAEGLMQVMPGPTGLRSGDLFAPSANVAAGAAYLQLLAGLYGLRPGCVADRAKDPNCQRALVLVLAAYNAGQGAVAEWGGVPPYQQTRAYVRAVEGYLADLGGATA